MMKDEEEFRLEEWKSLRQEVARKQEFCERLILGIIGANFAIHAFAVQQVQRPQILRSEALRAIIISLLFAFICIPVLYKCGRTREEMKRFSALTREVESVSYQPSGNGT
jgi:hypothetical protein